MISCTQIVKHEHLNCKLINEKCQKSAVFWHFSSRGLHSANLCGYFAYLCVIALCSSDKNYAKVREENAKFRKAATRKVLTTF